MHYWRRLNLFVLYFFAISVNLGAAFVSISKLFILFSFVGYLIFKKPWVKIKKFESIPMTLIVICVAMVWICLSTLWSDVNPKEMTSAIVRHTRLLIIPVLFLLIPTRQICLKVLALISLSHVIVVCLSFLMYFGFHIPLTQNKQPFEYAVPFTSSLEQPVMSTLVVVLFWCFKEVWASKRLSFLCYVFAGLCVVNVFYVMMGPHHYIKDIYNT